MRAARSEFVRPVEYVHGNVLAAGGSRGALFRVDPISYPYLTNKRHWLGKLTRFAYRVGANVSVYRVCRYDDAAHYATQAETMFDRRAEHERWAGYLQGHSAHLAATRPFSVEVYVLVGLNAQGIGGWREDVRWAAGQFERCGGVWRPRPVPTREISKLLDAEEKLLRGPMARLGARRATTREFAWLNRRIALRGLCEPVAHANWQPNGLLVEGAGNEPVYEQLGVDLDWLWRDPIREVHVEDLPMLEVRTDHGVLSQATLTVGALPDEADFPGDASLVYNLAERVTFPLDVTMHFEWFDNKRALTRVRKKVRDALNVVADQASSSHGLLSWMPEEDARRALALDKKQRGADAPPMLRGSILLHVGGETHEQTRERLVEAHEHSGGVTLHHPAGAQKALYYDGVPRPDGGTQRQWRDWLTPEQFGALMPIGTHSVGSPSGVYSGRIVGGPPRAMLVDVTEASRTSRPPSWLLAGAQGSGKTTALQSLEVQAALRGSLVIDVDPKPDHGLHRVPELRGLVDVVELSSDPEHRGMFDPLVTPPPQLREDITNGFLLDLPGVSAEWGVQIRKAVRSLLTDGDACGLRLIDRLATSPHDDARAASEALGVWADSGIARLAFGDGSKCFAPEGRVTTIRTFGLELPGANTPRTEYDTEEVVAVAILRLLAAGIMATVVKDRSRHKLIGFDEAHFFLNTGAGRRLLDRLNRMLRFWNGLLALATQGLAEVGDVEALIGVRAVFGLESIPEARRALGQVLGIDPGTEADQNPLVYDLLSHRKGLCLVRWLDGRVAKVQWDLVYPHLLEALNTEIGSERAAV